MDFMDDGWERGDMIHTSLCSLPGPLIRLVFVLVEHRLGADHVPRTQRHHGARVAFRGRACIEMYAQCWILGTAQLAQLIRLAQSMIRFYVAKFRRLSEELRCILLVFEYVVTVACFMEQAQFVGCTVVLDISTFSSAFKPRQAFSLPVSKTHIADQACIPQTRHGAGVTLAC